MLKIVARMGPNLLSPNFVIQARKYDPSCSRVWQDYDDDDDEDEDGMKHDFWSTLDAENSLDETCFWVDVNMDGIQLFKNSTQPQARN